MPVHNADSKKSKSSALFAYLLCFLFVQSVFSQAVGQERRTEAPFAVDLLSEGFRRIASVYCDPNKGRIVQSGVDAINAMPERKNEPSVTLQSPDIDSLVNAVGGLQLTDANLLLVQQAALNGMVQVLDPDNEYKAPDVPRKTAGVGLVLKSNENAGGAVIVSVISGAPAAKAGILAGDQQKFIDANPLKPSLGEIVQQLQGEIFSNVTLTVLRNGSEITIPMLRDNIAYSGLNSRIVDNVGIIKVEAFTETSGRDVRNAVRLLRAQDPNLVGFIIDIRNNSGGLLESIIDTISVFVRRGTVAIVHPFSPCTRDDPERYFALYADETN